MAITMWLLGAWASSDVASATEAPFTDKPWREAVISVTDPDVTARFFKEIGGYEELGRGPLSPSAIAAWGLAPDAGGRYLLLRAPWVATLVTCAWLVSKMRAGGCPCAPVPEHGIPGAISA